jgi:hypothetical protein
MTEDKKKRGRPPLPITTKLERSVDHHLTSANAALEAIMQGRGRKGRRPKHALDQELVEGWADARRCGKKSKQAFVGKFVKCKEGRTASPKDIRKYVRRLDRELRRLELLEKSGTALDRDEHTFLAQMSAEIRRAQTEARDLIRDGEARRNKKRVLSDNSNLK